MYRIGIDLATVSRIKDSLSKPGFAEKVFSKGEIAAFYSAKNPRYRSLAANFAAKEAFSKALGTGVREFSLNEVEILRDEAGCPYFNFYGNAARIMAKNGYKAQVSLTHEGDTAAAVVLLDEGAKLIDL